MISPDGGLWTLEMFTAGAATSAEWSTILLSGLENYDTIGAEYYAPAYVQAAGTLQSSPWPLRSLSDICSLITDGLHGKTEYLDEGVVFILSECVKEGHIDLGPSRRISQEMHRSLRRSTLKPGDVLVTKTGVYYGKSAVVPESLPKSNTIAHVARLVPNPEINPYFLSLFLNTPLGQFQLRRRGIKGTRPEIKLVELQDILVPIPPMSQQEAAEVDYRAAEEARARVHNLYTKAEELLLAELGLDEIDLSHQTTYTQSFAQAWISGRLDAEHFQPKYRQVIDVIKQTGQWAVLSDLVVFCQRGSQPVYVENGAVKVVNTKHLGPMLLSEEMEATDEKHWADQKDAQLKMHDVLLYSTGAYIGRTNYYPFPQKAIGSNHVTIMRTAHNCNSIFLALFLNSLPGLLQTDQRARGSAQREIYPDDIKQFTVWLPSRTTQEELAKLLISAEAARTEARLMLEQAKQRVEVLVLGEEA